MTETESLNCDVCLKKSDVLKCNECTFLSCGGCMIKWYNSQDENKCPQCKKINTFSIDYTKIVRENAEQFYTALPLTELMISDLTLFGLGEEIGRSFHDGQIFFPNNFVENFNNWPESIKQRFRYYPMTQRIDNFDEVVAYIIEEIDDESDLSEYSESDDESDNKSEYSESDEE